MRVTTGPVTQRRDVQGNWGLAGLGTELPVHVGLGTNCTLDRIEVRWPDAARTVETFTDARAHYGREIVQGAGRVQYLQ